jgi:hypothetical protein
VKVALDQACRRSCDAFHGCHSRLGCQHGRPVACPLRASHCSDGQSGPVGGGSEVVQIQVRGGGRRVSHHVCTVTESTFRASHRQAAVRRRSWMRRPSETGPGEGALERSGVQLVSGGSREQPFVGPRDRWPSPAPGATPVSDRHVAGLAGFRALHLDAPSGSARWTISTAAAAG